MNKVQDTKQADPDAKAKSGGTQTVDPCDKAHDAEQSRSTDEDDACFDSVR